MASGYPTSVDVETPLVDGTSYVEADNVNRAYLDVTSIQTMVGASGAAQSHNTDILTQLANFKAPLMAYNATNSFDVLAGSVVTQNSGGSIKKLRRNTATVNCTASNLDTGAMAVGYYYVYAVGDAAATTFTVKFSTSSSAPTGITHYALIGWFYNETGAVLDITNKNFGNVKTSGKDVPNLTVMTGATDITTTSSSYATMDNCTRYFYSSGRPVKIRFCGHMDTVGTGTQVAARITVATTEKIAGVVGGASGQDNVMNLEWCETLAAGTYTITADWKRSTGSDTVTQLGTSYKRIIIIEEA